MYTVSDLWKPITSQEGCRYEVSVVIGDTGRLITRAGDAITFGGTAILIGQASADAGYSASQIVSLSIYQREFAASYPSVGSCLSAELKLTMLRPAGQIERRSLVRPYVRATDRVRFSEWIPQGQFFIDTREYTQNDDGLNLMSLHCYDAMLMTEQEYPTAAHSWPVSDIEVVSEIAAALGVGVDPRTWEIMTEGYSVSAPLGYSMREVLGSIGAMYAGNWIMNYDGDLLLVALNGIPAETNFLVDNHGDAITFGGDRILV